MGEAYNWVVSICLKSIEYALAKPKKKTGKNTPPLRDWESQRADKMKLLCFTVLVAFTLFGICAAENVEDEFEAEARFIPAGREANFKKCIEYPRHRNLGPCMRKELCSHVAKKTVDCVLHGCFKPGVNFSQCLSGCYDHDKCWDDYNAQWGWTWVFTVLTIWNVSSTNLLYSLNLSTTILYSMNLITFNTINMIVISP